MIKKLIMIGLIFSVQAIAASEGFTEISSYNCKKSIFYKKLNTKSYNLKARKVVVIDEDKATVYSYHQRGQYYDSVWTQYKNEDGEILEYSFDDGGNSIVESIEVDGCNYRL